VRSASRQRCHSLFGCAGQLKRGVVDDVNEMNVAALRPVLDRDQLKFPGCVSQPGGGCL
jgi:hypothetical protein